ncbi:hypothetical protein M513_07162 [Trichuris suis]|uniref:Uncharacterized protein n=1 Tax=Trichuris suis TaxID=68888 RepID=A0A085M484_9BILA|nr:hypothetical protein M513_07162 [Trichuris suis]
MINEVTSDLYTSLADYFFWVSDCMAFQAASFMLSRVLLTRIYDMLFYRSMILLFILFFISVALYFLLLSELSMEIDELEMLVFAASFHLGTFVGLLLPGQEIHSAMPLAFIMPLCIGIAVRKTNVQRTSNMPLLTAVAVGPAFGLLFICGCLSGLSISYLSSIASLCVVGAVELQIQLARVLSEQTTRVADQWRFIVFLTIASTVCYL